MKKPDRAERDAQAEAHQGEFDGWATTFHEFYPPGERLDREYRLSRLLVLAGRSWITHIDNRLRAATGQSRARWQALFTIAFGPQPVTMTDLGTRLFVQWPTLVRVIEGLEQDGLISRINNPNDGRSRLISLTDEGLATVRKIQPILDDERRMLLQDLDDKDLELCADFLQRMFDQVARTG